jgi:SAM-dependent methyltransferase
MAEYNDIYRRAHYYDIVFRRNIIPEVDFLIDLFVEMNGRRPVSMADLACGPGYHAREFARRGLEVIGLDLRPEMLDFARDQAASEGLNQIAWMTGDIRDFHLPRPVDIMLTSYDSIDCLCEQDELIAHFNAVGANLNPDGIYVTESTHPRDCSMFDYGQFSYHGSRDGVGVDITWAVNNPVSDPVTLVVRPQVLMRVDDNGEVSEFRDEAVERFLLPGEYAALVRLSGALTLERWYGDFRLDQALDNSPGARRMIGVLRKRA